MLSYQLRQLGRNGGNEFGLITCEQLATPKSAKGLLFEIHVGKGLPISVLHHKAAIQFLDWTKAAGSAGLVYRGRLRRADCGKLFVSADHGAHFSVFHFD